MQPFDKQKKSILSENGHHAAYCTVFNLQPTDPQSQLPSDFHEVTAPLLGCIVLIVEQKINRKMK